jgi:hypothetical protein
MFGVIRHYHFDKKDSAEADRLIREEFVPLLRRTPGFMRERMSKLFRQKPEIIEGPIVAHD